MKIAVFHELPMGGARRVVNDFASELKQRNIVDEYVVDTVRRPEEAKCFSKVFFFRFSLRKWDGKNWRAKLFKDSIELYELYKLHKKIAKIIDKRKYDVVIIHPSKITQAPFLLQFLSTKKVYYAHEAYRIMYERYFGFRYTSNLLKNIYELSTRYIKKQIDRTNLKHADYIFVNSKNTRTNILRFYSRRSKLCYPGVDTNFFSTSKKKRKIDVLFLGSTIDNTDGFYDLKNAIDVLSKKITFKTARNGSEWIDDIKLRDLYRQSKVVFCGAYNEPFGLIPLEAIACGCRIVAIKEGGYRETSILGATHFSLRNSSEIARNLKKALNLKSPSSGVGKKLINEWRLSKRAREFEVALGNIINSEST